MKSSVQHGKHTEVKQTQNVS